jgi:hypothetical protein
MNRTAAPTHVMMILRMTNPLSVPPSTGAGVASRNVVEHKIAGWSRSTPDFHSPPGRLARRRIAGHCQGTVEHNGSQPPVCCRRQSLTIRPTSGDRRLPWHFSSCNAFQTAVISTLSSCARAGMAAIIPATLIRGSLFLHEIRKLRTRQESTARSERLLVWMV